MSDLAAALQLHQSPELEREAQRVQYKKRSQVKTRYKSASVVTVKDLVHDCRLGYTIPGADISVTNYQPGGNIPHGMRA